MTRDNAKREEIRRKTAEAITLIEEAMRIRYKLPNPDNHDINDLKAVARNMGEVFVRNADRPDFDPLALLLAEMHHVEESCAPKQSAEAHIALCAVAKAFGLEHQFNATVSAEAYARAHDHPPKEGCNPQR